MSKVVLVQRQSPLWGELDEQEFLLQSRAFCKLWGKPEDYIERLYQLWNNTFTFSYCETRQALKDISLANIASASSLTFIPYEGYNNIPLIEDAIYFFMDDDDWVDPDISRHLMNIDGRETPVMYWRSANIGSPNQEHPVFIWGMNGRCMTNNYAVSGHWLMTSHSLEKVIQHKDAAATFARLEKDIPHLDLALTVTNKSPVSSVSLDRGLAGDHSSVKLIQLIDSYVERMNTVTASDLVRIPWAAPLLEKTVAIFDKVLSSKH